MGVPSSDNVQFSFCLLISDRLPKLSEAVGLHNGSAFFEQNMVDIYLSMVSLH